MIGVPVVCPGIESPQSKNEARHSDSTPLASSPYPGSLGMPAARETTEIISSIKDR